MTVRAVELTEPPRAAATTTVRVLFFGRLADLFGRSLTVAIPAGGCCISALKARVADLVEGAGEALAQPTVRVAIDQVMGCGDPWVTPGQEVAFLPAFSGG